MVTRGLAVVIVLLVVAQLVGCATLYPRRDELPRVHLGMTAAEVLEAWGQPQKINRTIVAGGTHEQWIFTFHVGGWIGYSYATEYLYFENRVLVARQN